MKLREIFIYELEYRLRSGSTWLYAAILFGLSFMLVQGGTHPVGPLNANAPQELATIAIGWSAFAIIISAALFGDAAVRDHATGMDPLVFTAPLRKIDYLGGRFLAALVVNAIVLFAIPLGLAAPMLMLIPGTDPAAFGPFRAAAYLQPYLVLLLPNLVFSGAVLFTTGVIARHVVPVYLGAIGLMIGYGVIGNYLMHPENPVVRVLADPLGINTVARMTQYWTAAEKNARLIGFPGALIWNRLTWLTLAGVVLAVLHRRFRFAHPDGGGRRREARREAVASEPARPAPVAVPRVAGTFGIGTAARQTISVARNALVETVATRAFVLLLLASVILTLLWGWNVGDTVFETSTWPLTFLVAEHVLSLRVVPILYALIALYAGELVWKEREAGVAEIADAAPVPEWVALLGRFLALVAMLALIQAGIMLGGIVIQAFQGYYDFEVGLYLRIVFGLNLTNFALLAALAMTIHVLVNHKYVGHVVVLGALLTFQVLDRVGLVRHYLLLYGRDPGWTYSDMNGFGPFLGPVVWFRLYWAAWALLLAVVATALWVRGREHGVRHRLRQARARFTGPVVRTAGVAIALILVLGGFIFYNTNVLNEYRTADEQGASQAEYEKRYARFAQVAQPTIVSADLRVEVFPDAPAVDIRGSYRVVNRTGARIDSMHVYVDPEIDTRSIGFDRAASAVLVDEEVGYRIFALERALEAGESMELVFDVGFRTRGFPNGGIQTDVVANGTYFNRRWLPFIGYQPAFELTGDEARERFGLAPRPPAPEPDAPGERRYREPWRDADLVQVETIVGTAADQTALAYGALRRSWTENGRRYFHYVTEVPVSFAATVISGKYAVREDRWKDIELSIFHHPEHSYNLDRMLRSMKASLEYFTEQFGPYPYGQLRVVELPRYDSFGRAHPYTVAFTEDYFITRVQEDGLDQPFYGMAHEVAHTWWGGMTRGAEGVRGGGLLTESLANYSAMMLTERTYGVEAARQVYDFQMNRYLTQRANMARDVPLLRVADQPWIFYGKGAVVMYLLRDYIGADAVNTALRRYFDAQRAGVPPYPTSLDLYAQLRAVTPDSLQYLLTDLFETVTLWDVRTQQARVQPTGTGQYVVTLDIVAKKLRADSDGNETEVPMDDFVEIGVFAAAASGAAGDGAGAAGGGAGEPLYLQRHRIRSGEQTIRVTVPREPARAGIDPRRKLIDRQRGDNVVDVEPGAADAGGRSPGRLRRR